MWVAPEARRTGAARALIGAARAYAYEKGACELALSVTEGNTAAIDLYFLGGAAMLVDPPRRARDEIYISAAGPLVSLALAGVGFGLGSLGIPIVTWLGWVNLVLALFNLVMSLFGVNMGLYSGGPTAIIFCIICIALAAFSFLLDFDSIDKAIKGGAPANTAWYFAFGLMVTLVWLYLEILRLLSYMRN